MTKWNQLIDFLDIYETVAYNEDRKKSFKKIGQQALKELVKKLDEKDVATNCEVSFNPGGIAVSGDHHLKGDLFKGGSFDLFFSLGSGNRFFTYRKTKNKSDYSGDLNRQAPFTSDINHMIRCIGEL